MSPTGLILCLAMLAMTGPARGETLQLGAILPLSGPAAGAGARQMRGIQRAIDEANQTAGIAGRRVEMWFEDSGGQPEKAIELFRLLSETHPVPVIFTSFSNPTLAMAPLSARAKVLLVNASGQADKLALASPFLINTIPGIGRETAVLARFLMTTGRRSAVLIYEHTAEGISGRDDFQQAFQALGGTIAAADSVPFGQRDFRPVLTTLGPIKADVMVVFLTTFLADFARDRARLGLTSTVAGTSLFQDPDLIAEPSAEGFIHTRLPAPSAPGSNTGEAGMDVETARYHAAARMTLAALGQVLASGKPVTGAAIREQALRPPGAAAFFPEPDQIDIVTIHGNGPARTQN